MHGKPPAAVLAVGTMRLPGPSRMHEHANKVFQQAVYQLLHSFLNVVIADVTDGGGAPKGTRYLVYVVAVALPKAVLLRQLYIAQLPTTTN